jgi:Fic family protein
MDISLPVEIVTTATPLGAKKGPKKTAKKKTTKKAKATKVAESTRGRVPLFGAERITKALAGFKTTAELSKILKVTKVTAQNYVNRLRKNRKVETKKVRQGDRGPLAIAYRVG